MNGQKFRLRDDYNFKRDLFDHLGDIRADGTYSAPTMSYHTQGAFQWPEKYNEQHRIWWTEEVQSPNDYTIDFDDSPAAWKAMEESLDMGNFMHFNQFIDACKDCWGYTDRHAVIEMVKAAKRHLVENLRSSGHRASDNPTRDRAQTIARGLLKGVKPQDRQNRITQLIEQKRCAAGDFDGSDSSSGDEAGFDAFTNYCYYQSNDLASIHPWLFWEFMPSPPPVWDSHCKTLVRNWFQWPFYNPHCVG